MIRTGRRGRRPHRLGAACAARTWSSAGMPTSAPSRRHLARRILGVGTYIIATEPLGEERAAALLPSNAAIADINWILDYFRLTADHRLLFGGRVSYSAMQPPRLSESMRQRMVRVFPELPTSKSTTPGAAISTSP
jgi:glycine/D-amino acid oxidase-like deaminating enzyme